MTEILVGASAGLLLAVAFSLGFVAGEARAVAMIESALARVVGEAVDEEERKV